jgi:hypothetical protein
MPNHSVCADRPASTGPQTGTKPATDQAAPNTYRAVS